MTSKHNLDQLIATAETLALKVLDNCDDWSEGRAYAHSVLRWKDRYEGKLDSEQPHPEAEHPH